jgi:hypothetical protein
MLKPRVKRTPATCKLALLCLLSVGCAGRPSDAVDVTVLGLSKPIRLLCLVRDSGAEIVAMEWYFHYEGWALTPPADAGWNSFPLPRESRDLKLDQPIQWAPAVRYGVVIRLEDRTWRVRWFNASQLPIESRPSGDTGPVVTFDMSDESLWHVVDEAEVKTWDIDVDRWIKYGDPWFDAPYKRD